MAFKMKGSPMQRNFGVSPMKDSRTLKDGSELPHTHNEGGTVTQQGQTIDPNKGNKRVTSISKKDK